MEIRLLVPADTESYLLTIEEFFKGSGLNLFLMASKEQSISFFKKSIAPFPSCHYCSSVSCKKASSSSAFKMPVAFPIVPPCNCQMAL